MLSQDLLVSCPLQGHRIMWRVVNIIIINAASIYHTWLYQCRYEHFWQACSLPFVSHRIQSCILLCIWRKHNKQQNHLKLA